MFRGVATVSLDSKNRLVVPARYRDALLVNGGGRVVITADPSQCLLLYPLPEWEPIEKKLNGLSDFNPRTRSLKQLLVGYAHDIEMDSAGRVLLPPMLRKFAELDKSVVLVGQGSKVELWNEARWEAQVAQALTSATMRCRPSWKALRCDGDRPCAGAGTGGGGGAGDQTRRRVCRRHLRARRAQPADPGAAGAGRPPDRAGSRSGGHPRRRGAQGPPG
jgi:MraZ protein